MKYDISKVLPIEQVHGEKKAWEQAESQAGIIFPEDYKNFTERYGVGAINGFLWILSPFCKNENLNTFHSFKDMEYAYNCMKKEISERLPYEFYHEGKGLFPWGVTDNGDELYWNFRQGTADEIVVLAAGYENTVCYKMNMEEFLFKILTEEIVCPFFPNDLLCENNFYQLAKVQ